MLIAETKSKKPVSLYLTKYNSPLVAQLRTQPLVCPSCKSPVIVKSGQQVMPHFAHKSKAACSGFSENESSLHLLAKTSLNRWFLQQSLMTELEKNYAEINRRADIGVTYQQTDFAVEVQCSPISAELLNVRSADYRSIGVIPFWILPSGFIQKSYLIKLSAFHQQFIRHSSITNQYYLLTYSPIDTSFTIYHHLIPVSKTMFLTSYSVLDQNTVHFPSFPIKPFNLTGRLYEMHVKMNEKWYTNVIKFRRSVKDPLMRKLYETNLSLFEIPPWVGLMLKSNMFFSCSAMEWQSYLYIRMSKEQVFFKQQLVYELQQLIGRSVLQKRTILEPLQENFCEQSIEELLNLLLKCGVIVPFKTGYSLNKAKNFLQSNGQNRAEYLKKFHENTKALIMQEYNRR